MSIATGWIIKTRSSNLEQHLVNRNVANTSQFTKYVCVQEVDGEKLLTWVNDPKLATVFGQETTTSNIIDTLVQRGHAGKGRLIASQVRVNARMIKYN